MATTEQVKKLQELLGEITRIDIDKLIYNHTWGSINFESAKFDLERLYTLCNHFKVLPVEQLPSDTVEQIFTEATLISQTVNKIRGYAIEHGDSAGARDHYVNEVKVNVDKFYKCLHIYIPYLAYQKGEIQNSIEQLTSSVDGAKSLLEKSEKDITDKSEEINKIIDAARKASASVGAGHFTTDFMNESKRMEEQANKWLRATSLLAGLSLIAAIYFLFAAPDLSITANAIQYVSSKILILVLFITATLWCGNLYKAAKHQAVANKFKGNSLKTFQAFVNATDDRAVRDAILVETTRAIFSESATGYISNDSSGSEKSTKIVEIVKNSMQTTSATKE